MEKNFSLGIQKIKDIEFFVNESVTLTDPQNPESIGLSFEVTTNFNVKDSLFGLLLTVSFKDNSTGQDFMRIKTINEFRVPELKSFEIPGQGLVELPDALITTTLSLSYSHTRALLAKNATGTKFESYYLPIINPTELAMKLFKHPPQK